MRLPLFVLTSEYIESASVAPKNMRDRSRGPLVILLLQIRHHTRREEEAGTNSHLHTESQKEGPACVDVHGRATEAASEVKDNEQDAAIAGVVRAPEDVGVAEGRDLDECLEEWLVGRIDIDITYDRTSDHGGVQLRHADADGEAHLAGLSEGQQADNSKSTGPGAIATDAGAGYQCYDQDECCLEQSGHDQPSSLAGPDFVSELAEYETSYEEAVNNSQRQSRRFSR